MRPAPSTCTSTGYRSRRRWPPTSSSCTASCRARSASPTARSTTSMWIVTASAAETPTTYHLYDRGKRALRELFSTRPELKSYRLAPMHGEIIRARDGLELPSYLTLPHGKRPRPDEPLPMVLAVHGGPWARDAYGFDAEAQWLADRGFAVLSVNFRGSDGLRQGVRQCRRPGMGPQDARRPDRRRRMGGRQRHRAARPHRHHGRLVRRLCGAGRPHLHARRVLLRRRHRRALQPGDAAGDHPALLGRVLRDAVPPRRRSEDRGRQEAAVGALAAQLRRQHHQAAADRPGRQRPARQAGRVRPDHRRRCAPRACPSPTCCIRRKGMALRCPRTGCRSRPSPRPSWWPTWAARPSRSARISRAPSSRCPRARGHVQGLEAALSSRS